MKKILINLSNLHVGGGIQVAVSFIHELSNSNLFLKNFELWLSTEVHSELIKLNVNFSIFSNFRVIDFYGIKSIFSFKMFYWFNFKYKTVFSLFGPVYMFGKPNAHIVGLAMPSIIYKDVAISLLNNSLDKLKLRLKLLIQQIFFLNSDILIVELDSVKFFLLKNYFLKKKKIAVVNNSFSSIYKSPSKWDNLQFKFDNDNIKLGYLGRNYLHKNTAIFPYVQFILKDKYKLNVSFYVTFNNQEWMHCDDEFRKSIINVGPLSVTQCPSFYNSLDGIIFPSLLECFSATPLEAMLMKKPIFLSDREFNRSLVKEHGFYFNPLDPEDIAFQIYSFFVLKNQKHYNADAIRNYAINNFNATIRMEKYLTIINNLNNE